MRPACHNRMPREPYVLVKDGVNTFDGRMRFKHIPSAFVDRCAVWDGTHINTAGDRYPVAHGWDCSGCRWLPAEHAE